MANDPFKNFDRNFKLMWKFFWCFWVFCLVVVLAAWAGGGYVVWHFLKRFW